MERNVGIIGLGGVGKMICYSLMKENLFNNIYLIDINESLVEAEVKDLTDGSLFSSFSKFKKGSYNDLTKVDFLIISAGISQSSTSSRLEQVDSAVKIFDDILNNLKRINYDKFIIICSNPVDILTYYTYKKLNISKNKIIGSGTLLDTNRYKIILSELINVPFNNISGYVLGEHGEGSVNLFSSTLINNVPLNIYLKEHNISLNYEEIEEKVKRRGFEIVEGKKATFFGISECVNYIIKNIIFDTNNLLPLSTISIKEDFAYSYLVNVNKSGISFAKENEYLLDNIEKEKMINSKDRLIKLIKDKNL